MAKVKSEIVKLKIEQNPSTDLIEQELIKRNINPLRWAVVAVYDKLYTISVADLKD